MAVGNVQIISNTDKFRLWFLDKSDFFIFTVGVIRIKHFKTITISYQQYWRHWYLCIKGHFKCLWSRILQVHLFKNVPIRVHMLFKHVSIFFWNTCPYAFETHVCVLFGIMKKASWKAEGATSGKYQTKVVRYRPDVTFNRNNFLSFILTLMLQ